MTATPISSLIGEYSQNIGNVVVVGQCSTSQISELIALEPESLLIVCPEQVTANRIQRKLKPYPFAHCQCAVVAADSTTVDYFVFNNPRYNSIILPKNIGEKHKNIKLQHTEQRQAVSFNSVIAPIKTNSEKRNVLVLAVNGAEFTLLESVSSSLYEHFTDVLVLDTHPDFYQAPTFHSIEGFNQVDVTSKQGSGALVFRVCEQCVKRKNELDALRNELEEARTALQCEKQQLQQYIAESAQTKAALEEITKDNENLKADSNQLKAALSDSQEQFAAMNTEQQQMLEQEQLQSQKYIAELDQVRIVLAEKNSDIEKLNAVNQKLKQELGDLQEQFAKSNAEQKQVLETLNNELSEKKEQLNNKAQELQALDDNQVAIEKTKAWLEQELSKAKEERASQAQSIKIANKLNLKLQTDLNDLRSRYADKQQTEQELRQLIDELYVKLKQASEFYYVLEQQHPEILDLKHD